MESRTEQRGNIEIGIVSFQGKEFAALGAVTDDGSGRIAAYLGKDGILTNWTGKPIGTYRITSTWRTPRSFVSSTYHQVYATIDGKRYTGRSAGEGMLFRGRIVK